MFIFYVYHVLSSAICPLNGLPGYLTQSMLYFAVQLTL